MHASHFMLYTKLNLAFVVTLMQFSWTCWEMPSMSFIFFFAVHLRAFELQISVVFCHAQLLQQICMHLQEDCFAPTPFFWYTFSSPQLQAFHYVSISIGFLEFLSLLVLSGVYGSVTGLRQEQLKQGHSQRGALGACTPPPHNPIFCKFGLFWGKL